MPVPLLKDPHMQFGAITFFAKEHKGDTCGSNGLPLTPNSIILVGRAQFLKTIKHQYLCQYLDIIRGKHGKFASIRDVFILNLGVLERTVVVSQHCGKPLSDCIGKRNFELADIKKIAFQVLTGLNELHKKKIIHRSLSSDNILLQDAGDVKLFNYGLYHMTASGALVSFPIM